MKCPSCRSDFRYRAAKKQAVEQACLYAVVRCPSCASRLRVFVPLIWSPVFIGFGAVVWFGMGAMFIDVFGGLLDSAGVRVERHQLQFINYIAKFVGALIGSAGVVYLLWAAYLLVTRRALVQVDSEGGT